MNVNGSSAAKALSLFLIDMGNVQRLFFYEEVGASASKNPLFNYSNIIKIIRRKKMLITNFNGARNAILLNEGFRMLRILGNNKDILPTNNQIKEAINSIIYQNKHLVFINMNN